jgi:NADPH:quinone reductase-like Zn-dependent oxidoreductase
MKQRFVPFVAKPQTKDLALFAELVQTGVLVPAIDKRYPLSDAANAVAYVGAGRARGKVVVSIAEP